jgi:arabinofuranosyltransferase
VDFSTSGLENPLTHLLLLLFVLEWGRSEHNPRGLIRLCGVGALALVNRLDLALLLGPALAVAAFSCARRSGPATAIRAVVVGMVPLAAWTAFSVFYYGFPLPNTAYAKLATGIPAATLIRQGLYYFDLGFWFDPVTVLTIAALPIAVAFRGSRRDWPLVAGVVLTCLYVVRVGGDFMYGRFLVAPFFVSLLVLQRGARRLSFTQAALTAAAVLAIALTAPYQPSLLAGADFGASDPPNKNLETRGVHDERRWYYPQTGLLRQELGTIHPNQVWVLDGLRFRQEDARVVVRRNIGFLGYFAGARVHIIDVYALADPLLARLPALPDSRIGHFQRLLPPGYPETVTSDRVLISDPSLAEYYRHLRVVISGPLWSRARLKAILDLNLGRLDHLITAYTTDVSRGVKR